MGSGKTTVANILAKKLNLEVIEMDDLIVKQAGKSINQIFEDDGEGRFRELELQTSKDLRRKHNVVISTGGGVVMNKINIDYLKENGKIIFLKTSFLEIEKRIKNNNTRPLFRNKKIAKKLFIFRQKLYEEYADLIVDTDFKSIKEVATSLIKKLDIKNFLTENKKPQKI